MLRQGKPKNARAKRAMEKREPQEHENAKTVLFVNGPSTSDAIKRVMKDLAAIKRPYVQKFGKKNTVYPFEDASSLEFFARKNDTSIQLVSFHSKKRPHSLIFTRTHDSRILDMLEFHINPDTLEDMLHFRGRKTSVGAKPMIVFHGTPFESPVQTKYTLAKSLLLDFFRGEEVASMDVEGLQYLISISAGEESEGQPPPQIHLRVYTIRTLRSGQRLPRVEVEEMGPRLDFRVGREKFADEALWKVAMKKPKTTEPKTKKNIQTDPLGDKIGKIHIGSQDLGKLQTRKMKGLKRSRTEGGEAETAGGGAEGEVPSCKKPKE